MNTRCKPCGAPRENSDACPWCKSFYPETIERWERERVAPASAYQADAQRQAQMAQNRHYGLSSASYGLSAATGGLIRFTGWGI